MPDRFKELQPFIPPLPAAAEPTRTQALRRANRSTRRRMAQILALLVDAPRCIFECAAALSILEQTTIHDHQISGRFRAMVDGGLIEKAGTQRLTPSGCKAEVYQPTLAGPAVHQEQRGADAPVGRPSNPLQTGGEG